MSTLGRDLRYGVELLRRSPGLTVVATITLAFGIGVTSAQFSVVSGALLNPVPWDDPSTLVGIVERNRLAPDDERAISTRTYLDWREQAASFAELGATEPVGLNLTDGEAADRVQAARVTPSSLRVAGVRPLLGRGFSDADAAADAAPVVILSETLWRRRYGADPAIVGRAIEIDSSPVTVVGVQPAAQWFPSPWIKALVPLKLAPSEVSRSGHRLTVFARLGPGVSLARAQSDIDLIAARTAEHADRADRDWEGEVFLPRDRLVQGATRTGIWILMAAVGFVLLIACANVANLLLARGAQRRKEIAVRCALGATRSQLVVQLLTESAALALLALPFALLVTRWTIQALLTQVPPHRQYMAQFFRFDPPVWAFCALAALATALLFGLLPALRGSRLDLSTWLREGGERGSSVAAGRLRVALVVSQIGVALALLASAGLMTESFMSLQRADAGFETDHLVVTEIALPEARYREADHWRAFQRQVRERLGRSPGVVGVAVVRTAPFGFDVVTAEFGVAGRAELRDGATLHATWVNASPNFHELLDIPILRGRGLELGDSSDARRVIVVNEALARLYLGADPVGQRLVLSSRDGEPGREHAIVGVARDIVAESFTRPSAPRIYAAFEQAPTPEMSVIVRTRGETEGRIPALRAEFAAIDPELALFRFESMESRIERSQWQPRLFAFAMSGMGGLALLLAGVGVYGLVSYSTSQRTRELGIRSALGAAPLAMARLVLRETGLLAVLGLGLGTLLALAMARVLRSLVYEISAFQPLTLLAVAALLGGVAVVASLVPAQRATRVDPMIALRDE